MSTVLQTKYSQYIAPAVEGMIAEMTGSEVGTRLCETAAGIPFGKAVSWGANVKGCVLGGAAFLGLSVRDITLVLTPVDPLSTTPNPLDAYGRYTNVSVMSRGHMWCKPQALVVPGNDVYYDPATGVLGNASAGLMASGWVKFSKQPVDGETLVINGAYDVSLERGGETASLGPGARHVVLPGTGHACCIEDPAAFDAAVAEFLRAKGLFGAD